MSAQIDWKKIKHFSRWEFDDPDFPKSGNFIDYDLLLELDKLREDTGWPIIPHGAVGGCVDVNGTHGHSKSSYHLKINGCKACDFHFITSAQARIQANTLIKYNFNGIGIYYDWVWKGTPLKIGFHVDMRPKERTQLWKRKDGKYIYLLEYWD